tara:strand:- start:59 stop:322 length:264 start_codon:yes stop_codon:yes gene_type:complete
MTKSNIKMEVLWQCDVVTFGVVITYSQEDTMHEQSSSYAMREQILNHPRFKNSDAHESSSLYNKLSGMTFAELVEERKKIGLLTYED